MNRIPLQVPKSLGVEDTDTLEDGGEVLVRDMDEGNTEDQDAAVDPQGASYADGGGEAGSNGSTTSDRPGIDDVMRHVRETMGDHAEGVIRALQRDDTQIRQLDADRRRLREAIGEVEDLRQDLEAEVQEADPTQEALSHVPPEQIQLLEAWMHNQGYVKQEDLTEREKEDWVYNSNQEAIEVFGDDFGRYEGDDFVLNEAAQESMAPVYDRVVDQQNLDYRDLYVLANFPALLESAKMQGHNEAIEGTRKNNGQRVYAATRGTVATRNAGGTPSRKIYDRSDYVEGGGKKPGGFRRISDVLAKAAREARSA